MSRSRRRWRSSPATCWKPACRRFSRYEPDTDDLIAQIDDDTSCVVVQYPDILGRIGDISKLAEACHAKKALLIAVVTEPVALGAIKSPGEMGADIVVGEGQSIGVGLQFGGPYVGLFACSEKLVRQMPGACAARRWMPRASAASC
jgi:glycine dehydrogenase subunit 1